MLRLINLISKDTYVVFYISCIISRFDGKKESETNEKQAQFCSNLMSQIDYDVNQ